LVVSMPTTWAISCNPLQPSCPRLTD
jgi:hypothetical protein